MCCKLPAIGMWQTLVCACSSPAGRRRNSAWKRLPASADGCACRGEGSVVNQGRRSTTTLTAGHAAAAAAAAADRLVASQTTSFCKRRRSGAWESCSGLTVYESRRGTHARAPSVPAHSVHLNRASAEQTSKITCSEGRQTGRHVTTDDRASELVDLNVQHYHRQVYTRSADPLYRGVVFQ